MSPPSMRLLTAGSAARARQAGLDEEGHQAQAHPVALLEVLPVAPPQLLHLPQVRLVEGGGERGLPAGRPPGGRPGPGAAGSWAPGFRARPAPTRRGRGARPPLRRARQTCASAGGRPAPVPAFPRRLAGFAPAMPRRASRDRLRKACAPARQRRAPPRTGGWPRDAAGLQTAFGDDPAGRRRRQPGRRRCEPAICGAAASARVPASACGTVSTTPTYRPDLHVPARFHLDVQDAGSRRRHGHRGLVRLQLEQLLPLLARSAPRP